MTTLVVCRDLAFLGRHDPGALLRAGDDPIDRLVQGGVVDEPLVGCLLYTSDAADERSSVDLGGRRIIKKKKQHRTCMHTKIE